MKGRTRTVALDAVNNVSLSPLMSGKRPSSVHGKQLPLGRINVYQESVYRGFRVVGMTKVMHAVRGPNGLRKNDFAAYSPWTQPVLRHLGNVDECAALPRRTRQRCLLILGTTRSCREEVARSRNVQQLDECCICENTRDKEET